MSVIPKIKLSSGRKREKCDLSFDCSTTTNFGAIQPTMAREMIPNSKFEVKVSSLVRLGAMPLPTFGRMFMTHRHVFVPYVDVCPQFDAFLSSQPYHIPYTPLPDDDDDSRSSRSLSDGSYIPNSLPKFDVSLHSMEVLAEWADWTIYEKSPYTIDDDDDADTPDVLNQAPRWSPILLSAEQNSDELDKLKDAWDDILHSVSGYVFGKSAVSLSGLNNVLPAAPTEYSRRSVYQKDAGLLRCGAWFVNCDNQVVASTDSDFAYNTNLLLEPDNSLDGYIITDKTNYYVTLDGADYIGIFGSTGQYLVAFKLRPVGKRIRTILQGLGYQFTPNLKGLVPDCNWLKLLAFYKAWFNLYRPKREFSFTETLCYDLIKNFELPDANYYTYPGTYAVSETAHKFINSLGLDCYGYLPQDYFGMSVLQPNANYMGDNEQRLNTNINSNPINNTTDSINGVYIYNTSSPTLASVVPVSGGNLPAQMQIALRILKYVNKNTVVGRSIHDYIKAHFGVSLDSSHDLESVYEIGSVSIPIEVNDVMSTADTESDGSGAYVGEYAGRGIGFNKNSNSFTFENKKNFGVWITLTCVMPKSGYYQGILRENNNIKRYDFFTPEFDALGYEVLQRSEISSDYPVASDRFNPLDSTYGVTTLNLKKAFGFVPRYSSYKVGRNIVNGDLSLRGTRNDMQGYTLDRVFPYDNEGSFWMNGEQFDLQNMAAPAFVPNVVFDDFRKIDPADNLGKYNRIFYYTKNDLDHFIINNVFNVTAWLPCKSLTESFDTITDEDGKTIDVTHS